MPRLSFARILGSAAILLAAGCGRTNSQATLVVDPGFDVGAATSIEVYETGGLAGFVTDWMVRKETGAYLYTRRRGCVGATCPPAIDSARGTLSAGDARALFDAVARDTAGLHAADFGTTPNGADMIHYVVRLRTSADVVTDARGDEGTMPPAMRRIVEAVHAALSAARR